MSASEFTRFLAEAGGGAVKNGGKGMEGGLKAIAENSAKIAIEQALKPSKLTSGKFDNVIPLKSKKAK